MITGQLRTFPNIEKRLENMAKPTKHWPEQYFLNNFIIKKYLKFEPTLKNKLRTKLPLAKHKKPIYLYA